MIHGISIAVVIHSLDRSLFTCLMDFGITLIVSVWGLIVWIRILYHGHCGNSMGSLPPSLSVSCSFAVHWVDRSLFGRLRDLYGISIAVTIRSFHHSLDWSLFTPVIYPLSWLVGWFYRVASKTRSYRGHAINEDPIFDLRIEERYCKPNCVNPICLILSCTDYSSDLG